MAKDMRLNLLALLALAFFGFGQAQPSQDVSSQGECAADGSCTELEQMPSKNAESLVKQWKQLSESERQWVLEHVGQGATSAKSTDEEVKPDAEAGSETPGADEEAGIGPSTIIFGVFSVFVVFLIVHYMRTLMSERARYHRQQICKEDASFKKYLLYRFCYWYTWTPGSAGIVLCNVSLVLIIAGGLLLRIFTGTDMGSALYTCWIWIAAPDGGGSAETAGGRIVGAMVSMGGMLVFALLMSVVSAEVEETLQEFRAGSVPVIEGAHCVILGWSPLVPTLIQELCCAAKSRGGRTIAILSPMPKIETEELLREGCESFENSTVVVRTGDASSAADLEHVAVASAKQVVVLSQPGLSREAADARTLNVMLRLQERKWPRNGTCLVQCELVRNKRLFKSIAHGSAEVITIGDSVGELMVQCSKQSGLAGIITSILGFEGDEFYMQKVKGTSGMSFGEVLLTLPSVIVVGIKPKGGVMQLVPPLDITLQETDELVMLAEDVSTCPHALAADASVTAVRIAGPGVERRRSDHQAETVIVFGWNEMAGSVMQELDKSVGPGSRVIMFSPKNISEREEFLLKAQRRRDYAYKHIRIDHICGPLGARFQLEELPLENAHKILILADSAASSANEADGDMLAVLLQVRDILSERKSTNTLVITPQVLDHTTTGVIQNIGIPDFINSNELAGRILALVCEHANMSDIVTELLSTECHLCIADLADYSGFKINDSMCFDEVALAAASVGEIAVGWSAEADSDELWELNPKDRKTKRPWTPESRIVALRREVALVAEKLTAIGSQGIASPPRARKRDMLRASVGLGSQ